MPKVAFRKSYKAKRLRLSEEEIETLSLAIANKSLGLDIWDKTSYHLFLPIVAQREVNTEYLLHILQGKDKSIVISKSNFNDLSMQHFLLQDSTQLIANSYGIVEPISGIEVVPTSLDVVFVPLLAYDENGNRLGYGKGFYDRFLKECQANVIKIGLSFFEPEVEIPTKDYDVKLDYCVTPEQVYVF